MIRGYKKNGSLLNLFYDTIKLLISVAKKKTGYILIDKTNYLFYFFFRVYLQSGLSPGSEFERGDHTIIYSANDRNGVSTSCFFSFSIKGKEIVIMFIGICFNDINNVS